MKYLIPIIACITLLTSCEKIVAEDISDKLPVLLLPSSGSQLSGNYVQFKWQEMEGASKYHLMVVSPNFTNPQAYVLDTMISGTEFFAALDSNSYELKLVGVNAGYRSDTLGPIPFEVNISGGGNSVTLQSPSDGAADNSNFSGTFAWLPLSGATSYEFSLREGTDFTIGSIVASQTNISTTSYMVNSTLDEGNYVWGVKAYLATGQSNFSTHTFVIDTTTPNQAALATPVDLATVSGGTITFEWNNGNDPGNYPTTVTSWLEIANNTAFSGATQIDVVDDTADVSITTPDTYYWRVINVDAAGNIAIASDVFSFTVN